MHAKICWHFRTQAQEDENEGADRLTNFSQLVVMHPSLRQQATDKDAADDERCCRHPPFTCSACLLQASSSSPPLGGTVGAPRRAASHRRVRGADIAAPAFAAVLGLTAGCRGFGGHDGGAAERARGVEPQPGSHAVGVEPVAAPREAAGGVAVAELHDAHRALGRLRRPSSFLLGAGGVHVHGQGRRDVVQGLRAGWRLAPAVAAGRRPRGGHGQRAVVGAFRAGVPPFPGEEPPEEEEDEADHEQVDAHDEGRQRRAMRSPAAARVLHRRRRRRGRGAKKAAAPQRGHGFCADEMVFDSPNSREELPMVCIKPVNSKITFQEDGHVLQIESARN